MEVRVIVVLIIGNLFATAFGDDEPSECQAVNNNEDLDLSRTIVDIHYDGDKVCVGVMLSRFHVLTVEECIHHDTEPGKITVTPFGVSTPSPAGMSVFGPDGFTIISLQSSPIDPNFQASEVDMTFAEFLEITADKPVTIPRVSYLGSEEHGSPCLYQHPGDAGTDLVNAGRMRCELDDDDLYTCMKVIPSPNGQIELGSPLLFEHDGAVYIFGFISQQYGNKGQFIRVVRVNRKYAEIGCESQLSGMWSETINESGVTNWGSVERWDEMDPTPCGKTPPICIQEEISTPAGDLFPNQGDCPLVQDYNVVPRMGIFCKNSDQPGDCKCHDYSMKVKCPWVV